MITSGQRKKREKTANEAQAEIEAMLKENKE